MDFDKLKFKEQKRQDTSIRVFQKTNEERKAFLIEIQTLKEYREELIKSYITWTNFISELKNNILNLDIFKAFSYICKILKTFSESPQTTNFINNFRIELQKISEAPLFQAVKEFENFKNRFHVPDDELSKLKESFYISIQNQNVEIFQKAIYNFKKAHGFILSKQIINKYYIRENIFGSFIDNEKQYKNPKEFILFLCTKRIIKNTVEKLRKENKKYKNISDIEATTQAYIYYKELIEQTKEHKKEDTKQNQYKQEYIKKHGNKCYFISNNINNAPLYCCGKYAKASYNDGEYQIEINHTVHSFFLICKKYFEMKPIYQQIWILLNQEINCNIQSYFNEIKKATENNNITDLHYRKGKLSINTLIALKRSPKSSKEPYAFSKYRREEKTEIETFCDIFSFMRIEGDYKTRDGWKSFNNELFEEIKLNDNFEIEYTITDEYLKLNFNTFSSQIAFPIDSFHKSNLSNYPWIFAFYMLCLIHNRTNNNRKHFRKFSISTIIKYLGYDIEKLQSQDNLYLLPLKIYKYLNEISKIGINFNFTSKDLLVLKNYKFTSKKIKDTLKEFEGKICHYSFNEDLEKQIKENTGKTPKEHQKEAIEAKKQRILKAQKLKKKTKQ